MNHDFDPNMQHIVDRDAKLSTEELSQRYVASAHPVFGFQLWRESGSDEPYGVWLKAQLEKNRSATAEELYEQMLDEIDGNDTDFRSALVMLIRIDESREDVSSSDCYIKANFKKKNVLHVKGRSKNYFDKLVEPLINNIQTNYYKGGSEDASQFYSLYMDNVEYHETANGRYIDEADVEFEINLDNDVISIRVKLRRFSIGVKIYP